MSDFDSAWKEALDAYFEPFMAFFFSEAHREIDWTRGVEMLDKELQQRFAASALMLLPEIREIEDVGLLRKILSAIKQAPSPETLRQLWLTA